MLPANPAQAFAEGGELYTWAPLTINRSDSATILRLRELGRAWGTPESLPAEDAGIVLRTGCLADGRLALIPQHLVAAAKYVIEERPS